MRPAARVQAAIELLDEIIVAARDNGPAADKLASAYFKSRRYIGSKDRRAIRDWTWLAIRNFGERPHNGRTAFVALADNDPILAEAFDGSQYGPAKITNNDEKAVESHIPKWIAKKLSQDIDSEAEKSALLERAPLDIRINQSRTDREQILSSFGESGFNGAEPIGNNAVRLPTGFSISQLPIYNDGLVEIQDFGSQLIIESCGDLSDKKILDLCAGAGGKTLGLLDKVLTVNDKNENNIVASDVNRGRLSKIVQRQARLMNVNRMAPQLDRIRKILLNPGKEIDMLSEFKESFDIVLVDAPCSGTGTWRRNPETRWRLNKERLEQVKRQQARVLDIAHNMTKKGGIIVYAVCSILEEEGPDQIISFLKRQESWKTQNIELEYGRRVGDGIMLTPYHDGCDGFFFARLEKL